ncbi:MAG: histidinol dehydrogenase [Rhizobiaceae bacterium]
MPVRLNNKDLDFPARFAAFLAAKREAAIDVDADAAAIIADVRQRGDAALAELTKKFDRLDFADTPMAVPSSEIDRAFENVDKPTLEALTVARDRIQAHHLRQRPENKRYTDELGVELGWQWSAVESAGLYVPGGTASYPSSVLMNAVPARVAGVGRIVMVVPSPDGSLNPLVLAAARLCGISEIYRIGGAQAIAALAYGTETIAPVVKITGPGNAWVAAAKRQVFGIVGIDMIAGPSEVLVIADRDNDPAWIAADLLAQAEHDAVAQSILITDNPEFGNSVASAVEQQLAALPRGETAAASWRDFGAIIEVGNLDEAIPLANEIAPEHLELAVDNADGFVGKIRNAGAIFVGRHTPEVIGDYVGGSNHVLPTSGTARFSSGLSVLDFMKRTSILKLDAGQLAELGPAAIALAEAEGLQAHARSVSIRTNWRG